MKGKLLSTGKIIDVVKNQELDSHYWVDSKTGEKYYKEEIDIIKNNDEIEKYLESLDKGALLSIIKYGLRGCADAPLGITVEDIYECIGCQYISETM